MRFFNEKVFYFFSNQENQSERLQVKKIVSLNTKANNSETVNDKGKSILLKTQFQATVELFFFRRRTPFLFYFDNIFGSIRLRSLDSQLYA